MKAIQGGLWTFHAMLAAWALVLQTGHSQTYNFTVAKTRLFVQTNSGPAALDTDDPYIFVAQICSDDFLLILSDVTVTPPGRSPVDLGLGGSLECVQVDRPFATKEALDAAFPNGTYTATVASLFGESVVLTVELTGDSYPPAPHIRNYREAQHISAAGEFTLEWDLPTGPTLQDTVGLLVVSNRSTLLLQETVVGQPTPPDHLTIAAGTFTPGATNYAAAVDFHRMSAYVLQPDGNDATASYASITQLRLQAQLAPLLRQFRGANGEVRYRYNAVPGRRYRVDSSLQLPQWTPGNPLTATQPYEEFEVDTFQDTIFHRVVLLP